MHLRHLILAGALAGAALIGCKGGAPEATADTAPPASPAPDAAPAPADTAAAPAPPSDEDGPVTVKLLDAGAEPRQVLRVAPAVGASDALDVAIQLDERMTLGGRPLPSPSPPRVQLGVRTEVKAVAADGTVSYDLTVTQAEAKDLASAPEPAQRLMPQVLDAIRGLSVAATVTATGRVTQAPYPRPAGANPQVHALVASYLQALRNLPLPLPDEPVGVGARWEVAQRVANGRLRIQQTLVYELVASDGAVATTKVTVAQAIGPDDATPPGLPQDARVTSFAGQGTGTKAIDRGRVLPVSALLQVHSEAQLALATRHGEPGELGVVLDLLVKAGPAIDEPDPPRPEPRPEPEPDPHEGHDHP